ncbi:MULTISPECIES: TetR/AcrR family transcriptional regulator [unclassified Actinotalea]|uniref:TetR/AcrR family transcriptional regulator n=1 Tax=unclassified Actinotalea TaxID=2638618 RepID=UPI001C7166F6|nr:MULTISPECIES: TetR/AcrR family transcriptional regulator [unclassified Actinotalea]
MTTDPRALRSRRAMLEAARRLLSAHGPAAVTHQRVAQEAGVGRATVYRHWPTAEAMLLDAMSGARLPFFADPQAPVRPWLLGQLRALADELLLREVAGVTLALVHTATWDEAAARRRDASAAAASGQLQAALRLAVASGELRPAVDLSFAAALVVGPLLYRSVLEPGHLPDAVLEAAVDALGAWSPADPPTRAGLTA